MKIGITNLKGGVGKTTLSINLAVCFSHMDYKVCIVDTDTNQNSMSWYGVRSEELKPVVVYGATDANALMKIVNRLHEEYDVVIMDGTPNLSEMNTRVISASNILLIPMRPGAHDARAMHDFMSHLNRVRDYVPNIHAYFVINEYDKRISVQRAVVESLSFGVPVLDSTLKSRAAFGESNYNGTGAYEEHDVKAKNEIVLLATEIINIATKNNLIN